MANERLTLNHLSNQVRLSSSRATVREFDDDHDMQEIKAADVYHSETPSNFERWQMVGLTATPMKQDEDEKQQQSKQSKVGSEEGDWNHDQPKGDAAEALMLYVGAMRNHPIGMCDDRRVRPYQVPEGGSAFYAASGTGQMCYHNDDGSHLIATNNPKHGKDQKEKERYASLRHVKKKPQQRKKQQSQASSGNGGSGASVTPFDSGSTGSTGSAGGQQQYKHEGETINTEVRCTSGRIEFYVGGNVVAYIDAGKFVTKIETRLGDENASHPVYGVNGGVGKTTVTSGAGAVLVTAPKDGPPTSQDTKP